MHSAFNRRIQGQKWKRARGFNLAELLVVMAVMVVLFALLVPAMKAAVERSRRGACMGNLQQIGVAFRLYAGDNNGYFPRGGNPSYPTSFYDVNQTTGAFIPGAYFLLSAGGYLENLYDVYFCPSYVANYGQSKSVILSQNAGAGYIFWGAWPPSYNFYHTAQTIHDPPQRALVGDCVDLNNEQRNRSHLFGKNNAAGANWLFVDGHVEWVSIAKLTKHQDLAGERYLLPDSP